MRSKLARKFAAGEPAFGVSVMIPSPQIVEMVGRLGFDWVLIDCEHGSISLESVELMVMAAEASGLTPIARPIKNSSEAIMQVLDRGAAGVQVPHVNTAAEAEAAVNASRYFPEGRRGLAAGTRSANYGYGLKMSEYVRRENEKLLVCIQIEEQAALDNLDDLLNVDGVDVFFVGPSDLSQSLQHPGDTEVPDVQQAIEGVFHAVNRAGKISGCAGNAQATRGFLSKEVQYIYTHLTSLLLGGAQQYFEIAKR